MNMNSSQKFKRAQNMHDRKAPQGARFSKKPSNIVLVGLPGSGKTVVGRALAYSTGYGFLDLDKCIEDSQGMSISEIIQRFGEKKFRALEGEVLSQLLSIRNHIVSVGGGAVDSDKNWHFLEKIGVVIWLNVHVEGIARRLLQEEKRLKDRPLLADVIRVEGREKRFAFLVERLNQLFERRRVYYERAWGTLSDVCSGPNECARQIQYLINRSYLRKFFRFSRE